MDEREKRGEIETGGGGMDNENGDVSGYVNKYICPEK